MITLKLKVSVITAIAALTVFGSTSVASAQSLYDAPPTPTSAFVRFIGSDVATDLSWRDQSIAFGDYQEGAYIAIESAEIDTTAGNYITVMLDDTAMPQEIDEIEREKGKVALQLLNLSSTPIALKTADDKITILDAVAPNTIAARQINPLAFSVKVDGANGSLGTLDLTVKRTSNPLIVVRADGALVVFDSALSGSSNQ